MLPLLLVITTFASIFAMAGASIGLTLEKNPSQLNKIMCYASTIAFLASVTIIMAFY